MIGSEILRDVDFLGEGKLVVRHHHERWDGTGYPDGLAGEEIPLAARVFAVADTLDALTTDRPYRPASDLARRARRRSARARGTQFDPAVVAAFDDDPRRARSRACGRARCDADDPDRRRRPDDPQADRDHARGRLGLPAARRRATGWRRSSAPSTARPEIVFLDIDMPRLNGIETCRRLRSRPGDGERDDRDAHRRLRRRRPSAARSDAGADLFLTKPFSPLHLLRLVDRIGAAALSRARRASLGRRAGRARR